VGSIGTFTQIGQVNGNGTLTFLDATAGTGNWQYEVTSVW